MDKSFYIAVLIAMLATIGIVEVIKNFYKPRKKKNYVFIAVPLSIISFLAVFFLPPFVAGCLLTIGGVQVGYQTIIQSFHVIIEGWASKIKSL